MVRRNVKALLLSRFCTLNGVGGGLSEIADGFHLSGDRGAMDFDFDAAAGYELAARIANADPEAARDTAWALDQEMRDDARDCDDDVRWAA